MSEMVERVAKAILECRTKADFHTVKEGRWVIDHDRELAIAAIKAMREPTNEMVGAGVNGWAANCYASIQWVWPTMIDAALRVSDENPNGEDPEGLSAEGIPARSSEGGDAPALSSLSGGGE